MTSSNNKVFMISLDGATFSVLTPLIKQGYMPALDKLMSHSVCAELASVVPPVTAPAWTSFMTGKHPSKHGIFDFSTFNPERYTWTINNARDIRSKTVWQILSEKNKRVVVLNLPYVYPPNEINGILVAGWDAPLTDAPFSYPPELSGAILRKFPDYKENLWVSELQPLRSHDQFEEFTRKLKTGFTQQAAIAQDLLSSESWDVFMVHFQQTDWIQHKLWTYIEHACNNPDDHSPHIEATRACYKEFDTLVGALVRQAEPLAPTTILLSDHGFGRLMGNINANFYLKQRGYLSLVPQPENRLGGVKSLLRHANNEIIRSLYRTAAAAMNRFLNNDDQGHDSWVANAQNVMRQRASTWDWSRTKAALVYAYQMGFVYINLAGRSPSGVVEPGDEYESIIADLIQYFKEIRHPRTGEHLVVDVVRGTSMYPSADAGIVIPDLILVPKDGYNFSFSTTEANPQISEEGTHRPNGVLIFKGDPMLRPGQDFRPNLIDIAPTLLHLLDLAVPSDLDGRVLQELVPGNGHARYENVDTSRAIPMTESYTRAEEDIIAQRLTGLGYLD